MVKRHPIKVSRIPLVEKTYNKEANFNRMPQLYLELLENKNKIKKEFLNVEHVEYLSNTHSPAQDNFDSYSSMESDDGGYTPPINTPSFSNSTKDRPRSSERSAQQASAEVERPVQDRSYGLNTNNSSIKTPLRNTTFNNFNKQEDQEDMFGDDDDDDNQTPPQTPSGSRYNIDDDDRFSGAKGDPNGQLHYDRFSGAQGDQNGAYSDDDNESIFRGSGGGPKTSTTRTKPDSFTGEDGDDYSPRYKNDENKFKNPPTLKELESKNNSQRNIEDASDMDDKKRHLIHKFKSLQKSYPGEKIQDYTIYSDYSVMKEDYEETLKKLSMDTTVESYKKYLTYGFMGVEYLFGNFFGLDMKGFTQQQLISMKSYDKLLIELGEKNYEPVGSSKWPVEVRLIFLIIINSAFFIGSKIIMKKSGTNFIDIMNNFSSFATSAEKAPRKKMKDPPINLDDD